MSFLKMPVHGSRFRRTSSPLRDSLPLTCRCEPSLTPLAHSVMSSRLSSTLSILSFLLPPDELPSLSALACELETDETLEAYKSQKPKPFVSWRDWDPSLRREVVEINRRSFCREGYGALAAEVLGEEGKAELDGICG